MVLCVWYGTNLTTESRANQGIVWLKGRALETERVQEKAGEVATGGMTGGQPEKNRYRTQLCGVGSQMRLRVECPRRSEETEREPPTCSTLVNFLVLYESKPAFGNLMFDYGRWRSATLNS